MHHDYTREQKNETKAAIIFILVRISDGIQIKLSIGVVGCISARVDFVEI